MIEKQIGDLEMNLKNAKLLYKMFLIVNEAQKKDFK